MDLTKFFFRSRDILFSPDNEFVKIQRERQSIVDVNKFFIIPVAVIISAFSLIGSVIANLSTPINSYIFIVLNTIILFLLVFTHCYISGKVISFLGKNIQPTDPSSNYYALSTYSQLPFFIALAVIKLFPSLIIIIVIGLYSGILMHKGSGKLTKVPVDKQLQFTILSILVMITIFIITSESYTFLYSEIIAQFSTFAAD